MNNISFRNIDSSSSEDEGLPPAATGELQARGIKHLDRMEAAAQAFGITAIIALIATIVILCLTLASYMPPLAALYAFSACTASFIVMLVIDCCQGCVAERHGLTMDAYNQGRYHTT